MRIAAHEVRFQSGALEVFEVDESIPSAVAALVHDRASDALLLARHSRYAIDRWIFDLPGGRAK